MDSFAGDESGFVLSVNVSSCIVATKKNVLGMAVGFEKTSAASLRSSKCKSSVC